MKNLTIIPVSKRSEFLTIVRKNHLHYSKGEWSAILNNGRSLANMRLARIDENGEPRWIGCACSCKKYSCLVFVTPYYRGRGVGTALIEGMDVSRVDPRESLKSFWKSYDKYE